MSGPFNLELAAIAAEFAKSVARNMEEKPMSKPDAREWWILEFKEPMCSTIAYKTRPSTGHELLIHVVPASELERVAIERDAAIQYAECGERIMGKQRDEARAEADRLRAEVKQLEGTLASMGITFY